MENSESAALMENWRNNLRNEKGDIFEIIKNAIMVAASDHPVEFQTKRHKIARSLFSGELIMPSGFDKCKKESSKVTHETEDETKIVGEVLTMNTNLDNSGDESGSVLVVPPMEKKLVPTCNQQTPTIVKIKLNTETKFQIAKVPVTPEKKLNDHGARVCSQGVAEVMRMKKILDKSGDESESESVLCDLLTKLESMGLSVKTLEATGIGKTVSALKKHASENVRRISVTLVKGWKGTVNEWINNQSSVDCLVKPASQQVKPTNVTLTNTERKLGGSEKVAKIVNGGVRDSSFSEKLEATKRKLREIYSAAEIRKKKRGIQVIELYEETKLGLLPQMNRCKKPGNNRNRQMGNRRR
ncbi:hypothetical protein L2E82_38678 [Cichorium intybus]|uniref:Uncharacterized protein n=1 Tax=Cichorium intybus TaxID=13427 RepID=A0ACB9AGM2_CICIN|nr:hypothetical protein L2E82_38678 [Cichorium intybus]